MAESSRSQATGACAATAPTRAARVVLVNNHAGMFVVQRLALAEAIRGAGYDVQLALPPGPEFSALRRRGFVVHAIPMARRVGAPWTEARCLLRLTRLYQRLRPALVHHFTLKAIVLGGIAARLACVPAAVNVVTGLGTAFIRQGAAAATLRAVIRLALRQAFAHPNQRTVFQNGDDCAAFCAQGLVRPEATALIRGSGVDVQRFVPRPRDNHPSLVVLAGRLLWDKGVGDYVAAARWLVANGVPARLALVGAPDPANASAVPVAQLRAWNDEGVIEWWGARSDMPAVLARADVVCLPSAREGLPLVLIEAAACACALVATDVPGCRDVVDDGRTGLLVPPGDAETLARALADLIADPDRRAHFGAAARARAEREFSFARVRSEVLAVYETLLARTAGG